MPTAVIKTNNIALKFEETEKTKNSNGIEQKSFLPGF